MFRKISILVAACSVFIAFRWQDQNKLQISGDLTQKEQVLMEAVLQSMKYNHYSPEELNDAFSQKVYDLYLKRLDNSKRFFLQEDVKTFATFKNYLDDAAQEGTFEFFELVSKTFDERFVKVKEFYTEMLAEPFDFTTDETVETDGEKLEYAASIDDLRTRWYGYLKLQVLSRVQDKLEAQEKAKTEGDKEKTIKTFEEIEKEERERLLKSFDDWAKNIDKETRDERIAMYINTFTNAYEPHSGYFPPLEKENFNIRMSGKLEGIGAQLREEDGFIKVVNVVPGSASWRQGELEVNDKIIKVAQGNEESVDVVDMRIDDVLPLIRGKKGTEVRLTVKKTSGIVKTIPIVRDVVVLEESYAKSAVIEHKKANVTVGLIDLRSFYADFEDPNGRRCARDVRREVEKLIEEKVDGIVIDLRFNGGGSLTDVVDMTGLFVERGPMVQVKSRNSKPYVLEDRDPSVLFAGPLVIMVNAYSASASEIMAAALQDYGRAVIVGTSPATFGKGTVQRFFSLDAIVPEKFKELGELGSIKVTIQKFYRINGGSTQLRGVTPDIILPGSYSYMTVGEQEEDFPMAWTEIEKASYRASGEVTKVLDKIKKRSAKRVASNKTFQLIDENAKWLKERQSHSSYSLNLEKYTEDQKVVDAEAEKYKNVTQEIEDLAIRSLKADMDNLASDTVRAASMSNWHKNLKKDVYLDEVSYIIHDWKKN